MEELIINNNDGILTYLEASEKYNIPVKALYELHNRGILPYGLKKEHEQIIEHISYVWGKEAFLRLQLSRKTKKKREKLIKEADLNKLEHYILNRYLNALKQNKHLKQAQVANEVKTYLGAPITDKLFKTIERMRKKAYNMHAKAK
jgi:hypothetical protein